MNKKLSNQISAITHVDLNTQQSNRIAWLNHYKSRRQFIDDLNEEIAKLDADEMFVSKKAKSDYYSSKVVQYDSVNRFIF